MYSCTYHIWCSSSLFDALEGVGDFVAGIDAGLEMGVHGRRDDPVQKLFPHLGVFQLVQDSGDGSQGGRLVGVGEDVGRGRRCLGVGLGVLQGHGGQESLQGVWLVAIDAGDELNKGSHFLE